MGIKMLGLSAHSPKSLLGLAVSSVASTM